MENTISAFLASDHDRLDALLKGEGGYEEFRRGLLKHVGMEEMILLPAVKRLTGAPAALASKIRLDHGALTALLVPTPTPQILRAIEAILVPHNELEERDGGLYAACQDSLGAEAATVLEALKRARDIPPAAHADGPHVQGVIRRALDAAGYRELRV